MDLFLTLIIITATVLNVWKMGQSSKTPTVVENNQLNQSEQPKPDNQNPPQVANPMPILPSVPVPPKTDSQTASDFVYPGATPVGNNTYQSSDDPVKITNWYKNRINSAGMNVTSFVMTTTNNNVLNKLVGANGSSRISVDISKNAGEAQTTIKLEA